MLKFQEDVDEETGQRVLTCFLLPQQAYHTESMGLCFAVVMAALCNRETIYIFMLWFVLSSSSFFSSPNLSRHRLDVCRTSTHGVALVRI